MRHSPGRWWLLGDQYCARPSCCSVPCRHSSDNPTPKLRSCRDRPELSEALCEEMMTRQLELADKVSQHPVLTCLSPWMENLTIAAHWKGTWCERLLKSMYYVTLRCDPSLGSWTTCTPAALRVGQWALSASGMPLRRHACMREVGVSRRHRQALKCLRRQPDASTLCCLLGVGTETSCPWRLSGCGAHWPTTGATSSQCWTSWPASAPTCPTRCDSAHAKPQCPA